MTEIDNRFAHWKMSFPGQPINKNIINRLPKGWEDNSYLHDDSPSIIWKVGKMDCCQLYFNGDKLSLWDIKDDKWKSYSSIKTGDVYDLVGMTEWLLLRLHAFKDLTSKKVEEINADTIDTLVGEFCEEYLASRKDLGSVAVQYWAGEIILEVQKEFGFE
jgi:hypothetical protein